MQTWWGICRFVEDIPQGVRNIITWFPLIWYDRDFDRDYLLYIMRKKLEGMEKVASRSCFKHSDQDAENMKTCRLLIDRIVAEECCGRNQQSEDTRYLFELMGKYLLSWWY